jgi:hypothetical protein
MKTIHHLFTITVSALTVCALWSACSDEQDNARRLPANAITDISASVMQPNADAAQTRVTGTVWDKNDAIGVFMTGGDKYDNRKYVVPESAAKGTFIPANEAQVMYWPENNKRSNLLAYYPYRSSATLDTPMAIDLSGDQSKGDAPDLLYANNVTHVGADNTEVAFIFKHKLHRLQVEVEFDPTLPIMPGQLTVTLSNMVLKGAIDLQNGTITTGDRDGATLRRLSDTSFVGLVMPQTTEGVESIIFTDGTQTFTYNFPKDDLLQEGVSVKYIVKLMSDGTVVLKDSQFTEWQIEKVGTKGYVTIDGIGLKTADGATGTVEGLGMYAKGETVTLKAMPQDTDNMGFLKWVDKNDANAPALTDENNRQAGPVFTFVVGDNSRTLYAVFVKGKPIRTEDDFAKIAEDMSGTYILANDIRLSKAVALDGVFTGRFLGNGHTISFNQVRSLFEQIGSNGLVSGLVVKGKFLATTRTSIGAIAETLDNGTLDNITVDGVSMGSNAAAVGMLVGTINNGVVTDCTIKNSSFASTSGSITGGIAGKMLQGTISDITVDDLKGGPNATGGIVGRIDNAGGGTIKNITVNKFEAVNKDNKYVGGIVGIAENEKSTIPLEIESCKITNAKMAGIEYFGGIGGQIDKATISDITVEHLTFDKSSKMDFAGLVAYSPGELTVRNCNLSDIVSKQDTKSFSINGGAFGRVFNGSFTDIYVKGLNFENPYVAGGIVGLVVERVSLENCVVKGKMTQSFVSASHDDNASRLGGIAGELGNKSNVTIRNCHTDVSIWVDGAYSSGGGIVGLTKAKLTIENCSASGSASAAYAGGLIGRANQDVTIESSKVTSLKLETTLNAKVEGMAWGEYVGVGGLIGVNEDNKITAHNSYYLNTQGTIVETIPKEFNKRLVLGGLYGRAGSFEGGNLWCYYKELTYTKNSSRQPYYVGAPRGNLTYSNVVAYQAPGGEDLLNNKAAYMVDYAGWTVANWPAAVWTNLDNMGIVRQTIKGKKTPNANDFPRLTWENTSEAYKTLQSWK